MGELDGRTARVDYMRDRQQHEGVRMHVWRPERSLKISRRVWIAWERATPSDAQTIPVVSRPACGSAPTSGSLGDIRRCGADTPKQNRKRQAAKYTRRPQGATTRYAAWRRSLHTGSQLDKRREGPALTIDDQSSVLSAVAIALLSTRFSDDERPHSLIERGSQNQPSMNPARSRRMATPKVICIASTKTAVASPRSWGTASASSASPSGLVVCKARTVAPSDSDASIGKGGVHAERLSDTPAL